MAAGTGLLGADSLPPELPLGENAYLPIWRQWFIRGVSYSTQPSTTGRGLPMTAGSSGHPELGSHRSLSHMLEEVGAAGASLPSLADLLFHTIREAVVGVDAEQRVVLFNPVAEQLFGYWAEDILGQPLAVLLPEDHRANHERYVQDFARDYATTRPMRGGRVVPGRHRQGHDLDLQITISRLENGHAPLFLAILRDVSPERAREAALERSLQLLRLQSAVNRRVVHAGDEPHLLEEVVKGLTNEGGFRFAWVGVPETGDQRIVLQAQAGEGGSFLAEFLPRWDHSRLARGPTGTAVRTARHAVDNDLRADSHPEPWKEAALAHGFEAMAAFPLIREGRVVATLSIYSDVPEAFGDEEQRVLMELTDDVSAGLAARASQRERTQVQQDLERVSGALNGVPELVLMGRASGGPTYINPAGRGLLGLAEGEGAANDWAERYFLPESAHRLQQEAWPEARQKGLWEGELLLRARGETVPLWGVLKVHDRGAEGGEGWSLLARNLRSPTREPANGHLAEAAAFHGPLLQLMETVPDLIATMDTNGYILYHNSGGGRLLGLADEEDARGQALQNIQPQWVARQLREEGWPQALEHGYWEGETALLAVDGSQVPISQVLVAHYNDGGEVAYVSTLCRPVRHRHGAVAESRIAADSTPAQEGRMLFKVPVFRGHGVGLMDLESVTHFQADGHYVRVQTTGGEDPLSQLSLADLEKRLDPNQFLRIHRSYIVNLRFVSEFHREDDRYLLIMGGPGKQRLPISRRKVAEVRSKLGLV